MLTAYIKGAPERVLEKCTTYLTGNGDVEDITAEFRASYDDAYNVCISLFPRQYLQVRS